MFNFFWVPALAFVVCLLGIFVLRPLASTVGLVDRPNARKRHDGDVPLVGGIAITVAIWVGALLFMRTQGYYVALLAGLTLLTITGVMDDLRGMSPITKLVVQLFAAILMTSWGGIYLASLGDLVGRREIELSNWGIPLTLFAAVSVINAMNMSDGLDGLCGGLSLVIFGWFAYLAGEMGNLPAQRMCIILCGALVGFLVFNMKNPFRGRMRVFLGDAGSLMLGFCIVWFAVELSQRQYNNGNHVPPVVMLWILGFVLIDLLAVVIRRTMKGKNPLAADRMHLHHVLLRLGLGPDSIVWLMLVCNGLMGLIGVWGWRAGLSEQTLFLLFLAIAAVHLVVMRNAWRVIRVGRKLLRR
ncbi:undecaprenyl/decaprenyl-phosphate alpha-N-acetylglucosaminyl 1-phosphate transferase [Cupriavidus respiraculi]|uniref:Undecaprenyl-phosphate alpha-N-acetylglucosaminyl 1-phosphate transferase n=1 Tax=Cupriavidus respiraculi TaxID=195930 RepID=A0ABN7YZP8_9BURK|nr:undecaprenyl/decaprenyl-phosphate alpha-N-acetylglucosaminyl 1-phosphate transferase [Cupriavidus respiraculi]CAG9177801.1 Undecaprenyl-phosphate alpha-N-acetylglucosaminyl 1-phosphate transferase [Cupriavidus respiraculi]